MGKLVRASDGRVHFSELKQFARSPAHYKARCERTFEPTRAMRIGTIVHHLVLGGAPRRKLVRFDGDARRGKEWTIFLEANPGCEIVTAPEWEEAEPIAAAVKNDPQFIEIIRDGALFEVPVEWEDGGLPCATGGIDIVTPTLIADLKMTSNTEPVRWQRHASSMLYHAQLAWYDTAARAKLDVQPKRWLVIGCEVEEPYAMTILDLDAAGVEQGKKSIGLWLEHLRRCEDNDVWPAYASSPIPWSLDFFEDDEAAQ